MWHGDFCALSRIANLILTYLHKMSLASLYLIPGLITADGMPPKLRLPRGDKYPPTVDGAGNPHNEDGSRRPVTPDQEESEAFKYRVEFEEMLERVTEITSAMGSIIKERPQSRRGQKKGTSKIIPSHVGPISSDCEEVPDTIPEPGPPDNVDVPDEEMSEEEEDW